MVEPVLVLDTALATRTGQAADAKHVIYFSLFNDYTEVICLHNTFLALCIHTTQSSDEIYCQNLQFKPQVVYV